MAKELIIDGLYCIPQKTRALRLSDCVPFQQDLAPQMNASGIAGVVLAHCNCWQCQHHWNCADRRTQEVVKVAARNLGQLRGLVSYDSLRIGESLRWIDEAVLEGGVAGAYAEAECCSAGLNAPRMYPLYGLCSMLRMPMVFGFHSHERWAQHLEAEVVAADFPDLDIVLAPPPDVEAAGILRMLKRFPRILFLLSPQDLQADARLCEYVETRARERVLFRSCSADWSESVKTAMGLSLGTAARSAYLSENATRVYRFPVEVASLEP